MKKVKNVITNVVTKIMEKGKTLYLTLIALMASSVTVFAAENKYAKNASDWVMNGVQTLAITGLAAFLLYSFFKKRFVQMLAAALAGGVMLVFVFDPQKLKTIADYLVNTIFG